MSIKQSIQSLFFVLISYAQCVAGSDHLGLENNIKHVARLMIHTLYNHNFDSPYGDNTALQSYLNPNESLEPYKTVLAQEPVKIANEYQMQMTETHTRSLLENTSQVTDKDGKILTKWICKTPITISLIKGPIEITYPATSSISFVSSSSDAFYVESINLEVSGQPQIIDYLKIRKKNCT